MLSFATRCKSRPGSKVEGVGGVECVEGVEGVEGGSWAVGMEGGRKASGMAMRSVLTNGESRKLRGGAPVDKRMLSL